MGDHYCCKVCGLRYEDCKCKLVKKHWKKEMSRTQPGKAKSAVTSSKVRISASPTEWSEDDEKELQRLLKRKASVTEKLNHLNEFVLSLPNRIFDYEGELDKSDINRSRSLLVQEMAKNADQLTTILIDITSETDVDRTRQETSDEDYL